MDENLDEFSNPWFERVSTAKIALLNKTKKHAVDKSEYYRERRDCYDGTLSDYEDFRKLPIIDRDVLSENSLKMLSEGSSGLIIGNTSGTTFKNAHVTPMMHFCSAEEREVWRHFTDTNYQSTTPQPITVRLISPDHGAHPMAGTPGVLLLPCEKDYHLLFLKSVLGTELQLDGFSGRPNVLVGTLNLIKLATIWFRDNSVKASDHSIKLVCSGGWHLTDRWRGLIEETWQAPVVDMFGATEVTGFNATQEIGSKNYLAAPSSFIEVLDLKSGEPIERGIGRVVVTPYLPLRQAQPLLRYDTGDIVDLKSYRNVPEFQLVGRTTKVIYRTENMDSVAVSPLMVNNFLDSIPDIAQNKNPRAEVIGLKEMFGWPKFQLQQSFAEGINEITLEIELNWSPWQFPDKASELRDYIYSNILDISDVLRSDIEKGVARFLIVLSSPGSTKFAYVC